MLAENDGTQGTGPFASPFPKPGCSNDFAGSPRRGDLRTKQRSIRCPLTRVEIFPGLFATTSCWPSGWCFQRWFTVTARSRSSPSKSGSCAIYILLKGSFMSRLPAYWRGARRIHRHHLSLDFLHHGVHPAVRHLQNGALFSTARVRGCVRLVETFALAAYPPGSDIRFRLVRLQRPDPDGSVSGAGVNHGLRRLGAVSLCRFGK